MRPNENIFDSLRSGTRHRLDLRVDESISLPVLVAAGSSQGKTLVVTANVHGDEYEGVRAIFEIFDELDPTVMAGRLIAVPIANPPAFWNGSRTSPLDGLNLARIMPGRAGGSASEKIAFTLARDVIGGADFYLDLHSGGIAYQMPTMVGFSARNEQSHAAAEIFGAPVVWGHKDIAPGRTISWAEASKIPWLYTEARGAGRIHPYDLTVMKTGIRNLLMHLKILPGRPSLARIEWRLEGDGNIDAGLTATKAGFLLHTVRLLQKVSAGEVLGTLVSPLGELLEEYRASRDGVVAMVRELPVVKPGDSLFLLANYETS